MTLFDLSNSVILYVLINTFISGFCGFVGGLYAYTYASERQRQADVRNLSYKFNESIKEFNNEIHKESDDTNTNTTDTCDNPGGSNIGEANMDELLNVMNLNKKTE
jgi:gas vesicle protein